MFETIFTMSPDGENIMNVPKPYKRLKLLSLEELTFHGMTLFEYMSLEIIQYSMHSLLNIRIKACSQIRFHLHLSICINNISNISTAEVYMQVYM